MKYEYEIVTLEIYADFGRAGNVEKEDVLKIMHDMAKKDWEFVSAIPLSTFSFFRQRGTTNKVLFFFRRPEK